jgi:hypothetical protein
MSEAAAEDRSQPIVPVRTLLCGTCGRQFPRTLEDLLIHTRVGWPKCCGETMTLLIERRQLTKSGP